MIYLTGDVHGNIGIMKFLSRDFPAGRLLVKSD